MKDLQSITLYQFNDDEYDLQYVSGIIAKYGSKLNSELPNDCDLIKQYDYFGINNSDNSIYRREVVDKKIRDNVKKILTKGNKNKLINEIIVCRRKLLMIAHNYCITNILKLNEIFEEIVNEVKEYLDESLSKEEIDKMFELLAYYYERDKDVYGDIYEYCQHIHQNDIKIVNSVIKISRILPDLKLDIENIQDKIKLDLIFQNIEKMLIGYGIDRFYRRLIKEIWKYYDENERLFDFRNSYELIMLYHLSIKLLTRNTNYYIKDIRNYSEDKIYDLARSLIDLLNLGNENKMKFLLVNNPVQYVLDTLEYSVIYDIHQCNVNGILYLCEKILHTEEKKIIEKLHMNVDDFMYITKNITESIEKYRSEKVEINTVDLIGKVTKEKIQNYFSYMCTNEVVNKDYNSPLHWDMINDDSQWLIPVRGSRSQEIYCPIPSVSIWGLHDRILSIVGYRDRGHFFENVVYDLLKERYGITVFHGKFNDNGKICETDGIIKIGSNIIIIECKTKPLTRVARGGDAVKIVSDFINSYLKSQAQAMRCEKIIRKSRHIDIYDDKESDYVIKKGIANPIHSIDFLEENIKIIRLSCVSANYWIMSESSIKNTLLNVIGNLKYDSNDKTYVRLNKEIDDYLSEKKELIKEYDKVYPTRSERIMELNSLLLSFDKLFSITELSNNKEELWINLKKITRIQSSTNDTWYHLKELLSY